MVLYLIGFEIGSCCATQVGRDCRMFLAPNPKCEDNGCVEQDY